MVGIMLLAVGALFLSCRGPAKENNPLIIRVFAFQLLRPVPPFPKNLSEEERQRNK